MAKRLRAKSKSATASVPHDGVLEEMTREEVAAMEPEVVVLPLGSTEPHGPHLPLGTDSYQVSFVARRAVADANCRGARALLYPTIPITNNANARRFKFACRIGIRTLMDCLLDIVTQCRDDGIRKIVIANGHGGNPAAIQAVLREISGMDDMPFVCCAHTYMLKTPDFVDPIEYPSMHGGESESSRMLHVRPDLVHPEEFADNPVARLRVPALAQTDYVRPWHIFVPRSAGGETRKSTAAKGKLISENEAAVLAQLLVELSAAKFDERFPYL